MSLYTKIFAAGYDRLLRDSERAGLSDMRARLLAGARGRTLEIGAGTGLNLAQYPHNGIELTLIEPSPPMARRLERRVAELRPDASVVQASAAQMPFDDGVFDSVVCGLVLCTVPDQAAALAEIRRVMSGDGQLLFLEHVRSDDPAVTRWQDRLHPIWRRIGEGCHCNRDTLAGIQAAGFEVDEVEHTGMPKSPAFLRPMIVGRAHPAHG
jgi:ubiquinone/menaquinone biosynthesis C-methylase UbiE